MGCHAQAALVRSGQGRPHTLSELDDMARSVWAVLAGFLFIGALAAGTTKIVMSMSPQAFDASGGTSNLALLLVMLLYSSVYGMVGCYIAARLAPSKPMIHAMILGVLGVIVTGIQTAATWGHFPAWFSVIGVASVLPLAWLGGRLRENEIAGAPQPMGTRAVPA
jgi:hypothetical protein